MDYFVAAVCVLGSMYTDCVRSLFCSSSSGFRAIGLLLRFQSTFGFATGRSNEWANQRLRRSDLLRPGAKDPSPKQLALYLQYQLFRWLCCALLPTSTTLLHTAPTVRTFSSCSPAEHRKPRLHHEDPVASSIAGDPRWKCKLFRSKEAC